jgi:hypothetical protein
LAVSPSPTLIQAPSEPPLTADDQEAATGALAAYRAMFDDWIAVAATSDYQNPRLTQHASGDAGLLLYKAVYLNHTDGVVAKGRPAISPRVTAVGPAPERDRATIIDCVDTTNWLIYKQNGELQDETPGGRRFVQALALRTGGTWKVNQLVVQAIGTC